VRSGDEDGENHVRLDDENTDTDRVDEESPEKPKRMVAKQKRRPMRYALFDSLKHGTHSDTSAS